MSLSTITIEIEIEIEKRSDQGKDRSTDQRFIRLTPYREPQLLFSIYF